MQIRTLGIIVSITTDSLNIEKENKRLWTAVSKIENIDEMDGFIERQK